MSGNYTIEALARTIYDHWCDTHKGRAPGGQALPCWAALAAKTRKAWWEVALKADQQVREQVHHDRDRMEARRRTRAKRSTS